MQRFRENPIAMRLTRRVGWPTLRGAIWLGISVGLVMIPVSLFSRDEATQPLFFGLLLLVIAAAILSPLFVASLAAIFTVQEILGDSFDLLLLTNLRGGVIAAGYVLAAVYRARVLLAVVGGLLTLPVAAMLWPILLSSDTTLANLWGPLLWWLCFLTFIVAGWYMNLVGAALGVRLALRWRDPMIAAALAPLYMLLFTGAALLLTAPLLWLVTKTPIWLFAGFSIFVFLFVPIQMRASQISGAAWWVQRRMLHMPLLRYGEPEASETPRDPSKAILL